MKRCMLFIEPSAGQINIFTQFTLPRLGSFILAGLVERRSSWNARVFIEGRRHFDLSAWIAEHGCPTVVGISQTLEQTSRISAIITQLKGWRDRLQQQRRHRVSHRV